jgi:Concanavalin A-like lectin/glucanases superfamily
MTTVSAGTRTFIATVAMVTAACAQQPTLDTTAGRPGFLEGSALWSTDTPKGGAGNFSMDFGQAASGGAVYIPDVSFLNSVTPNDVLSVAFWWKLYSVNQNGGSAFWINSPSSNPADAVALPSPDDSIQFTTAGQVSSQAIQDFPGYAAVGDDSWWQAWHHFAFVQNGTGDKEIWVDGQMLSIDAGTSLFPTDIDTAWLGGGPPDQTAGSYGLMDDFAIFAYALQASDIQALFTGSTPDQLPQASLVAYWAFNDPPNLFVTPIVATADTITFNVTAYNGAAPDTNSIRITYGNVTAPPTSVVQSPNGVYAVSYAIPNPPFPPNTNEQAVINLKDTGGISVTVTNSFSTPMYAAVLTPDLLLPPASVETNTQGFFVSTYQISGRTPQSPDEIGNLFAGAYGFDLSLKTDPVAGIANENGYFLWTNIVNFDSSAPASNLTDFSTNTPVFAFPGVLGQSPTNFAGSAFGARILAAIRFPAAGLYTMGLSCSDNYELDCGTSPLKKVGTVGLASAYDGSGAFANLIRFYVQEPGFYGFYLGYGFDKSQSSAPSLDWYTEGSDGAPNPINGTSNTVTAYPWLPDPGAAYVPFTYPTNGAAGVPPVPTIEAAISAGRFPVDPSTIKMFLNGVPVEPTVTALGRNFLVAYNVQDALPNGSSNTVTLTFLDGNTPVTQSWLFRVGSYTLDVIGGVAGVFELAARYSTNGGGVTAAAGDYALELPAGDQGDLVVPDASFANLATVNDVMAVSFWAYKYDANNGSAFWFDSPSVCCGGRAYQAHIPWYWNLHWGGERGERIFFDTGGCCDTNSQRIDANLSTFPPYAASGETWWNGWHFFVFWKNGPSDKQIWIDNQLFLKGASTLPLPTDIAQLRLGVDVQDAAYMHGRIDDFAVYGAVPSAADMTKLYLGAKPPDLPASDKLIAYWDFNDANGPTYVKPPRLTIRGVNDAFVLEWPSGASGFNLQRSPTLSGAAWQPVTNTIVMINGVDQVTIPVAGATSFYRLAK